jgi:hypothetical protein
LALSGRLDLVLASSRAAAAASGGGGGKGGEGWEANGPLVEYAVGSDDEGGVVVEEALWGSSRQVGEDEDSEEDDEEDSDLDDEEDDEEGAELGANGVDHEEDDDDDEY